MVKFSREPSRAAKNMGSAVIDSIPISGICRTTWVLVGPRMPIRGGELLLIALGTGEVYLSLIGSECRCQSSLGCINSSLVARRCLPDPCCPIRRAR
jgi:hypothetical protein